MTKPDLLQDMRHGQSQILKCLNYVLIEKLEQGAEDIKTLNLIFELVANIAATNK